MAVIQLYRDHGQGCSHKARGNRPTELYGGAGFPSQGQYHYLLREEEQRMMMFGNQERGGEWWMFASRLNTGWLIGWLSFVVHIPQEPMYCEAIKSKLAGEVVKYVLKLLNLQDEQEGPLPCQTLLAPTRALANLLANYR